MPLKDFSEVYEMKIEEIRPVIRFANRCEYTVAHAPAKTYDSRLLYITDGSGSITVGGESMEISRGLLIIFQGGTSYKFAPKESFSAFAVDFDLYEGYSTDELIIPVPAVMFDKNKLHERVEFEDSEFLRDAFLGHVHAGIAEDLRRLVEEYNSGRLYSKRRAEMMLGSIILELARSVTQRSKGAKSAERVLDYISEHYREPITNTSIAAYFGHEPCYLNRTVKQHLGSSIHRLVNKKRVEEGIKLLLTTDLVLDEIAERVGFSSASHFSKRCKDITGNNPSFYKNY